MSGFGQLIHVLRGRGFSVIGPTAQSGAIVYDEIASIQDLPAGWTDEQEAGAYRLTRRNDGALFGYTVGPHYAANEISNPHYLVMSQIIRRCHHMSIKHEVVKGNGEKAMGGRDPFRELFALRSPLSRLFDEPFYGFTRPDWTMSVPKPWMPALDVKETEKEYVLTADLPGVDKKDIDVQIKNRVLTLSGERKTDKEEKGKNFIRQEHSHGSFFRSLALPEDVKSSNVKAAYKDGVLTLKIPRMEGAKPNSIKISVE